MLVERGLFESRSQAAAAVMAGEVRLGPERRGPPSPACWSPRTSSIEVARGAALRLARRAEARAGAGRASGSTSPAGAASTSGASTGGFTDCLLQAGAARVIAAWTSAYGELDWRLREDPRVTVLERRERPRLEPGGPSLRART